MTSGANKSVHLPLEEPGNLLDARPVENKYATSISVLPHRRQNPCGLEVENLNLKNACVKLEIEVRSRDKAIRT